MTLAIFLQRGVTIMEVMVVMAILAIAAGLTIPLFVNHTERNRLKQSAEDFYNDVMRARAEALKSNADVTISIQTGAGWCYGLTTNASCNCDIPGDCALGQTRSTKYSGSVATLTAVGITSAISFESDRGIATPPGTVTFTSDSGEAITVEVNAMGAAQVCSSDIGGYEPC